MSQQTHGRHARADAIHYLADSVGRVAIDPLRSFRFLESRPSLAYSFGSNKWKRFCLRCSLRAQTWTQSSRYINSGEIPFLAGAGVTGKIPEAMLVNPPALVAVSEQLYSTPPVNPPTVTGDVLLEADRVTCPLAVHVPV